MNILWFSRHAMTEDQLADLRRIYGEDLQVKQFNQTVNSYKEILTAGEDCAVLAVVAPPAMLADLTNPRNNSKPIIRAIANRVPTGRLIVNPATGKEESEYMFQHAGWERVLRIAVETEKL